MRCLNLAAALQRRGADVRFLCRAFKDHPAALIAARGFAVSLLPKGHENALPPPRHADWLGAGIAEDAGFCEAALGGAVDWLIVDHYALDARWQQRMRASARRILVIDDLADRQHDADVLLDPNDFNSSPVRYAGNVPPHCRCLLGPRYALVSDAFAAVAPTVAVRQKLRRLLIFGGGGDPANLTINALAELAGLPLALDVVIGAANPHRAPIAARCRALKATLHVQTERMADLMAGADLLLGAGGTTHWERCLLGLPAVTVAVAENQQALSATLAEKGTCRYLGPAVVLPPGAMREAVQTLLDQPERLESLSRACREVVPDGLGASRVADVIINKGDEQ